MSLEESQQRLKAGRNDPCPCGSGKKYKKCHQAEDESVLHADLKRREAAAKAAAESAEAEEEGAKGGSPANKRARSNQADRQKGSGKARSVTPSAKNLPRRKAV